MNALQTRISEIRAAKMHCSQTMMQLMCETRGITDRGAVRCVAGLGGGMFSGDNCGTLLGGACVLSSYGGEGYPGEVAAYDYESAVKELVTWFEQEFKSKQCRDLAPEDPENPERRRQICAEFMEKTFLKCLEILKSYGIDPAK